MASAIDFFGLIGKPMLWKSANYGTIAVHIAGLSPNGKVATLTIDGGEASTPAQNFPELADGIGYAILGALSKRPSTRKITAGKSVRQSEGSDVAERAPARKYRGRAGEIRRQAAMGQKNNEVTF